MNSADDVSEQEGLVRFRKLWRAAVERAKNRTPEQVAEDAKKRPDLPGSGRMTRAEYHEACRRRAEELEAGPGPVLSVLREAGVEYKHTSAIEGKTYETWPAVAVARKWITLPMAVGARPEHPFLTLCGPTGVGKGQASAVAAANWAARSVGPRATGQGRPVMLLNAPRLSRLSPWELEPLALEAQTVRFLLLEDLGKEVLTGQVHSALFDILDARWGAQRRTVITANVLPAELHRKLDWEGQEPPKGQEGAIWRRISAHWVATLSRSRGVLEVAGKPSTFPAFDVPRRDHDK